MVNYVIARVNSSYGIALFSIFNIYRDRKITQIHGATRLLILLLLAGSIINKRMTAWRLYIHIAVMSSTKIKFKAKSKITR